MTVAIYDPHDSTIVGFDYRVQYAINLFYSRVLCYPDFHPLQAVSSDSDSFINTAVWFYHHAVLEVDSEFN